MTDSNITQPYYTLHEGDALEVLASMPDESIDAIVTDPPYELSFMGSRWDSTGIAYNTDLWEECLRVLKPGGHLLSFGGTRTYHRMAVAIEDAGFEIRDSIHWTYGSGFPKSLDVSKAIDKAAGAQRKVVGKAQHSQPAKSGHHGGLTASNIKEADGGRFTPDVTAPATPDAQQWQGWGTALKPSHEPIVLARKPLTGTVAANVLEHGTGALNIDGTRVGYEDTPNAATNPKYRAQNGYKTPERGQESKGAVTWTSSQNPTNTQGRWPANTILTHHPDCHATGETSTDETSAGNRTATFGKETKTPGGEKKDGWQGQTITTPVYECAPGCPVAELDKQNGGASRYFTTTEWDEIDDITPFLYQAKPSKRERNAGLDGLPEKTKEQLRDPRRNPNGPTKMQERFVSQPVANTHPTVKPVQLMRHLIRLITPPGGTVLDPFTGSGTTGVAAIQENHPFIGIEREPEYHPIITARLNHAGNVR